MRRGLSCSGISRCSSTRSSPFSRLADLQLDVVDYAERLPEVARCQPVMKPFLRLMVLARHPTLRVSAGHTLSAAHSWKGQVSVAARVGDLGVVEAGQVGDGRIGSVRPVQRRRVGRDGRGHQSDWSEAAGRVLGTADDAPFTTFLSVGEFILSDRDRADEDCERCFRALEAETQRSPHFGG